MIRWGKGRILADAYPLFFPVGIEGTAGSTEPLHEFDDDDEKDALVAEIPVPAAPGLAETEFEKLPESSINHDEAGKATLAPPTTPAGEGFSLTTKAILVAIVLAGCYGWVKMFGGSSKRSSGAR